jgi:predicted ATPase
MTAPHMTHHQQQQPAGPTQQGGIYTPGSIWAQAIERQQQQAGSKQASAGMRRAAPTATPAAVARHTQTWCLPARRAGRPAASLYFVGDAGSGKSTLIARFLQPNKVRACSSAPL